MVSVVIFSEQTILKIISMRKQVNVGRKLDQVNDGARRIFLRDGFVAANVDDITKAAGVSKATLYSYFPDKEVMFQDSMKSVFDTEGPRFFAKDLDQPASFALPEIAVIISDWLALPFQKQLFRLALTEAERFPKFASAYWANREAKISKPLKEHLDLWVQRGEFEIEDTSIAVQNLIAICESYRHVPAKPGRKQEHDNLRRKAVESGAKLFLRAYQTVPEQAPQWQYASGYR